MIRQIGLLAKVEMCNFWGINVWLHTLDKRAKRKGVLMALAYVFVAIVIVGYVGGLCYGMDTLGAANAIPAYLIAITTVLTLVFGVLKAGGTLYRKQGYEMLSAFPISNTAVVCSRFLRLYLESLVFAILVMITGLVMYGYFVKPDFVSLCIGILSIFIVPLVPVAVSAGVGMIITGISSRMKNKAWVEAGLAILLIVGFMLLPGYLVGDEEIAPEMLMNYGDAVLAILGKLYPPAVLLGDAIVKGSIGKLLLVILGTLAFLGVVIGSVSVCFHRICAFLFSTTAKHDYQKESLQKNSLNKALVIREGRRYFSSGVYVTNTIMGPIMGVVLSISFFFVDMEEMIGDVPAEMNMRAAIPFILGACFTMINMTAVSISMEGKEVWILKSLPLSKKQILDGKILFQLCLLAPFYVVAVIISSIALRLSILEVVGVVVTSAILILFSAVFGISVNLWLPKMQWDSEVAVVKQSASSMIGGLVPTLISGIFALIVMAIPKAYTGIGYVVIALVLVMVTGVLYNKNVLK